MSDFILFGILYFPDLLLVLYIAIGQVLYRFLEFFSNFDWDNFCISLSGPVRISSLPDMTGGFVLLPLTFNGIHYFSKLTT